MDQSFLRTSATSTDVETTAADEQRLRALRQVFGVQFSIVDVETCSLIFSAPDQVPGDWQVRSVICREVARLEKPEVIEEVESLLILAIPLIEEKQVKQVAVAGFVTGDTSDEGRRDFIAKTLVAGRDQLDPWLNSQTIWQERALLAMAQLFVEKDTANHQVTVLRQHVDDLSENLSQSYEEISLLHRIAGNLKISNEPNDLTKLAVEWLHDILTTDAVVAYFDAGEESDGESADSLSPRGIIIQGDCPLGDQDLHDLVRDVAAVENASTRVINREITQREAWRHPAVEQLVLVPLTTGDKHLGYLAALNRSDDGDFGTVEASLLNSVATMLAIHFGNIQLYKEQVNLFSGTVQTLVSAIDAKDPYTCGHSDRVARVAVRIGQELGCDEEMLNTIYLSGVLHDIGKIGVDDAVLRKTGKLTPDEYEQMKKHPELGYNILKDIRQIKQALPGVMHHHESWDGAGYPHGLAGEDIPFLARILAVADSFDAMGSDRSYRKRMKDEELDAILLERAGIQWDEKVVAAYFAARDDIREISESEGERIQLQLPTSF